MSPLSDRDKRTLRFGGAAIAIYLVIFGGVMIWKRLEKRRADYQELIAEAQRLKYQFQPYEEKAVLVQQMKETYKLDPLKLSKPTVVADASAAIQRSARSGGLQLGPMRETSARSASREIAAMQIEGSGPVTAVMSFVHNLGSLGYPIVVESVQLTPEPTKPGMVKVSLNVTIIDFEQWKKEVTPHA